MDNKKDKLDNPYAFPLVVKMDENFQCQEGMSLRDYLAAKAMQGFCHSQSFEHVNDMVRKSYKIADAMLEERLK
jgi:hypothetical protein